MTRHQRLKRTLRSPIRAPKLRRNRLSRRIYAALYWHFADGHHHTGPGCPYGRWPT